MKKLLLVVAVNVLFLSCNTNRLPILDNAYLGMTVDEYGKVFDKEYKLHSSSGKVPGQLKPDFTGGHLSSLAISVNDISDYDTAYTVYELGNDLSGKYGIPVERKETVWAGGTSKYFKWKKGRLEVEYSYKYDQVPGTRGLLYTGDAKVVYNSNTN